MKIFTRVSLLGLLCLSSAVAVSPASGAGNRCTDRCADRYHYRNRLCKAIPFKRERKRCEQEAKYAKEECKHRCR
jgi:hypothetical protein